MQGYLEMRGSDMIIFVPEELDHHSAEKIRRASDAMMQSSDFRETVFMDSAGIGMIMGRYKLMQALGGHVTAVHVSKRVRKILVLSGIYKIVGICEEAVPASETSHGRNRYGV